MNTSNNSPRTIFNEALEIKDARQRAEYLAKACGSDAALRQKIEGLIAADAAAGGFLESRGQPSLDLTTVLGTALTEKPGDRIGRYKLLQQIGEGGCGVVYMAEQEEPVRRRVALKVIKLGMDTKNVIARFEAERQALAVMDHPNIAKVLDAGSTEAGRLFFVMELVKGIKITEHCDQNNLPTPERLKLFGQVCHAVQHAHQKGIIHRDLKPSNILVTVNDGVPVPKVIDFGIAKATTQQRLTDKTLFTAFEQFIGTPAYMSPEQAVMTSLDIDTRSDIYALGVLLYELLTGTTPFEAKELMEAGLEEMRRTIREKEPARPSTRLSTMLEGDLAVTAKHRQTEPAKLTSLIRGDLDWIVMKALEKDRARRYETANAMGADVQHYLSDEAVTARPPGMLYVTQKFLKRRRKEVFTAVLILAFLGAVITAESQLRHAEALRQAAELAKARTEESEFLNRVIAGSPLATAEQDRARTCAARLASRVKAGLGSEADHELLARFLTREVRLSGRVIQVLNRPDVGLMAGVALDYPVDGVGVILRPFVTVDGTPVEVGNYPVYLAGSAGGIGTGGGLHLDQVVTTPGKWQFSCVLEAQLVDEKEKYLVRHSVRLGDYRALGTPVRIVLPPVHRTFLRQLPSDYPFEVTDEQAAKQIAVGLTVSGGRVVMDKTNDCTFEFKIILHLPSRSLPIALRVDLIQLGEMPLQRWVCSLVGDAHSKSLRWGEWDQFIHYDAVSSPRDQTSEYALKFILTPIQALQLRERAASMLVSIRSAREVALLSDDVEHFLSFPEVRKVVPITVEDHRNP